MGGATSAPAPMPAADKCPDLPLKELKRFADSPKNRRVFAQFKQYYCHNCGSATYSSKKIYCAFYRVMKLGERSDFDPTERY